MRLIVLAGLAACGGSSSSVGTVRLTIFSNGTAGSEQPISPKPLASVTVFEAGGESVTTDAMGQATLAVMHDPATVHVVAPGMGVTTIVGVPVDGEVRIGNDVYLPTVGTVGVVLPDIGAQQYIALGAYPCMRFAMPSATPLVRGDARYVNATCTRIVGEAVTSAGTQVTVHDGPVPPNANITMDAFVPATSYRVTVTGAPSLPVAPEVTLGVVDPGSGFPIYLPSLDGPATIDFVRVSATDGTTGSSLLVQTSLAAGDNTVDASRMLAIPTITHVDAKGASWSVGSSGAPNRVQLDVATTMDCWRVFAPASTKSVAFPSLPAGLSSEALAGQVTGTLQVFELPQPVLTTDALYGAWDGTAAPFRLDRAPIASARTAF